MASVTGQQLVDRIRQRVDMVGSAYVTDAELLSLINQAKLELDDLLIEAYGQDYFATSTTFATVVGTQNYSLTTITGGTFYKLMGVDIQDSVSGWKDVDPYTFKERNEFTNSNTYLNLYSNKSDYRYRIVGSNINIRPTPNSVMTFQLHWTPQSTTLATTASSFDDVNGWSEYMVVRAAISVRNKEESDTTELERDLERLRARITAMKTNRDASAPLKVVENNQMDNYPWWYI